MQFEMRYAARIADGSIDLTFRRWKRAQVIAGNTYRTAAGRLVVDDVSIVGVDEITDGEAVRAGYPTAAALVADLRGTPHLAVYRVVFHLAREADPRDELAATAPSDATELDAIRSRLERFDKASRSGPWTAETLALIAANPAIRAGDLAPKMDQELVDFKLNVRKLKSLGLTISLGTGYRLSPRGESFVAAGQGMPQQSQQR